MPSALPENPAVALVSLGCPKNLVDSERLLALLAEAGCLVGAELEDADVVLINTCGFIGPARDESHQVIAEAVQLKDRGQLARIVVAGCLAQRDGADLRRAQPGIDAVVGVNDREAIVQAVLGEGAFEAVHPFAGQPIADDRGRLRLTLGHTAYLRISEGCSRACAFCTIPAIRGPFRSKPAGQVLAEAAELIADGALELNLIGQDLTAYGRDLPDGPDLPGLLRQLDALDGARWIRLLYAYPSGVTDDLMDAMAQCAHVVPYLDIPLQHVADGVLRAMRRGVTGAQTRALIDRLRQRVPGIALRTTFIVGFPGETQADFEQLLAFVQQFRFDAAGVFEYSSEPGTPAAELPDAVEPAEKARRREALMLAQQEIAFAANAARQGQPLDVLVEGDDEDGQCIARHAGQAPEVDSVCLLTSGRKAGRIVPATVVGHDGYDLIVRPGRAGR